MKFPSPLRRLSATLLFLAIAIGCQFIALLDVLGYEYSALFAILIGVYAGIAGILARRRSAVDGQSIGKAFLTVIGRGLLLLTIAFVVSLSTTYFFRQCRIKSGLRDLFRS